MPELDEYGIPIKKKSTTPVKQEVDEFGIPIKKKEDTQSYSSGLPLPSSGKVVPPPAFNPQNTLNTRFQREEDSMENPIVAPNPNDIPYTPNPKNKVVSVQENITKGNQELNKKQELSDATSNPQKQITQNGYEVVVENGIHVVKPKFEESPKVQSLSEGQQENAGKRGFGFDAVDAFMNVGEGAVKGFGETAKGFAGLLKSMDDSISNVVDPQLGVIPKENKLENYAMYKLGNSINAMAEDFFPTDPTMQQDFIAKLSSGAGSIIPFVLGGIVGKAFKYGEFITPAFLGSMQNASSQYEDAIRKGADEDTAMTAFWHGVATGSLEGIPIGNWAKKLNGAYNGLLNKSISTRMKAGISIDQALQEGFQEFSTQVLNNASAKSLYDETRGILDGALEAGTIGIILGKTLDGITKAIQSKKLDPNNTPADKIAIQRTEEYVNGLNEKMKDVEPNDFVKLEDDIPVVQDLKKQKAELEMDLADRNTPEETKALITDKIAQIDTQIEEAKLTDRQEAVAEVEKQGEVADLESKVANLEAQKEQSTPATQELLQPQIDEMAANLTALKESQTPIQNVQEEAKQTVGEEVLTPSAQENIGAVENTAPIVESSKALPKEQVDAISQEVIARPYTAEIDNTEKYDSMDEPVTNTLDVTKRLEAGETIYTYNEQTEEPIVVNDITEYNALSQNGYQDWFAAIPKEPINKIQDEKPTTTTKPKKTTTGSSAKSVRQNVEESPIDTRPIKKLTNKGRKPRNQRKPGEVGKKALDYHPNSARDLVMQYFIGGGRIRRSVLEDQYGKKANKEFSGRINLLDKESKNTTIAGTADEIFNIMGDERFSSDEIRTALEEVLQDHHHPNGMAKEMVKRYGESASETDSESDRKEAEYHKRLYDESTAKNDETDGVDVDDTVTFLETMTDEEIEAYAEGKDKVFDSEVEQRADDWINSEVDDDGTTPWDDVIDKLESLKSDNKNKLNAFGILPEIWNTAIDGLILAVKAAKATVDIVKAVDNFIKELKDKGATFDEKEVRESIEKSVGIKAEVKEEVKTEPKKEEPKSEKVEEKPKEKELKVAKRVEVSDNPDVNDDIKKGLKDLGTTYIPEKMKVNEADAEAYVSAFVESGELDKAIENVMDMSNGMTGLARGIIGAKIFDVLTKKSREATTIAEKQKYDSQAAKVAKFSAVQLKAAGQEINAGKVWKKLLQNNPEAAVQQLKDDYNEKNEPIIKRDLKDIRAAKKDLEEFLKTEEGQAVVREEVDKEIGKRAEGIFGKEEKKRISTFFDSLLIDTKGKLFDATFALPVAVYNGAINAMKNAALLGADAANAIKAGLDYVAKNHKGAWKQKDFELTMEKGLKTLNPRKKAKISKATTNKILDAWEKRLKNLNAEQRKKLLAKSLDELNNLGALSEERFKELYAEAMGLDSMTDEKQAEVFKLIDTINAAEKAADNLKKLYDNDGSRSDIDKALISWKQALRNARNANESLSSFFRKDKNIWETLTTIMQGNLLTPMSLITNIYSNAFLQPLRMMSGGAASVMDYTLSKLAQYTFLGKYLDPKRSFDYSQRVKGTWKGLIPGVQEGLMDFKHGLTDEEIKERDLNNKLQPLKAAGDLLATFTGKKKVKAMEVLNNIAEATAGVPANVFFKLLNLGDKPFRRMAELGKAFEIAELKGLKGKDLEKFILFPDEKSAEEIKAAGDEATFQKDNLSSKIISYAMNQVKNVPWVGQPFHFLLKGIVPYVKTPTNIIGESLNYALPPVTLARSIYHAAQGDRKKSLELFGKSVVGSMIAVVAYELLTNGLLTGADDKEDKPSERSIQYENVPPNSLNISALRRGLAGQGFKPKDDDVWVNHQKSGIFGMVAGMYANMGKDKTKEQIDKMSIMEMAAIGFPSILKSSFEQSYLQGTSALMSAVSEGGSKADRFIVSYVNTISSTAYPNTLSTISKASDDYIRSTKDETIKGQITNMFKNKMFMGNELPSKITLWGEKVSNAPEGRNKYLFALFDVTKYKNVDTENFGYKLYSTWNESKDAGYLPSLPDQTLRIKKQDVKLTPQQYEQYLIFVGKERRKLVEAYLNSPNWDDDSPEKRKDKLSRLYSIGREIGKKTLLRTNEELYKIAK